MRPQGMLIEEVSIEEVSIEEVSIEEVSIEVIMTASASWKRRQSKKLNKKILSSPLPQGASLGKGCQKLNFKDHSA
jgi:hypothetical protein